MGVHSGSPGRARVGRKDRVCGDILLVRNNIGVPHETRSEVNHGLSFSLVRLSLCLS